MIGTTIDDEGPASNVAQPPPGDIREATEPLARPERQLYNALDIWKNTSPPYIGLALKRARRLLKLGHVT